MPGVDDLAADLARELDSRLAAEDDELVARFPGERPGRQPVHTVCVPADQYDADLARTWGELARQAMTDHELVLRECLGEDAESLLTLVKAKLGRAPTEALRIDFDDGYGTRSDDVEDVHGAPSVQASVAPQ